MKASLHLNVVLLPVLIGGLILVQLLYPSKPWEMLLVGLGGAWLTGYLWARILARSLSLTREMRYDWAQVGDRLEERFTVTNNSFLPATWLEVNDHSTIPGYQPTRATSVGGHAISQWTTDGICTRRGLYTLGGTTIQTGDPLGIYAIRIEDSAHTTLLVLPPVVPLPPIAVSPGGYGDSGRPRAYAPEKTVGAAGVREYQPGDSVRLIHWPSTAKHDKPYVHLFDGTPASDLWILLDLDRKVQIGDDWNSTEEHGVILAASLADRSLRAGQGVGLVINGHALTWMPPRKNVDQRRAIFHALALAQRGELELSTLLARMGGSFSRQTSLVIITASLDANWLEALMPLMRSGIIPTVLLLDSQSFGGTQAVTESVKLFQRSGIICHVITQDLLNQPVVQPGNLGVARAASAEKWRRLS